jgi:hypothetical protein
MSVPTFQNFVTVGQPTQIIRQQWISLFSVTGIVLDGDQKGPQVTQY